MNAVKNWADHSSSEEEEEDDHQEEKVEHDVLGEKVGLEQQQQQEHNLEAEQERVYDYPTEPPYTAFVGNLSYSILDGRTFCESMAAVVKDQLQVTMNFKNGRMIPDKTSNNTRHRGFGYIEVETVGDLQKLMELNKCPNPVMAGRRIVVDTSIQKNTDGRGSGYNSNDRRRNSNNSGTSNNNFRRNSGRSVTSTHSDAASEGPKVFRGGRFNNNNSNNNVGNANQPVSDGSLNGTPTSQRPVLKLKPRSKPLDGDKKPDADDTALGGSNSSIFGSAKARDEQSWISQKQPPTTTVPPTVPSKAETDTTRSSNTVAASMSPPLQQQPNRDTKSSGRGDGGGRASSIRGGRGGRDNNNRSGGRVGPGIGKGRNNDPASGEFTKSEPRHYNKNKRMDGADKKPAVETSSTPVVTVKPLEPEKKAPAKPSNIFAALALDDSDSD